MGEHYFTESPESGHQFKTIRFSFAGRELTCRTDAGTFSRDHLDPGSALLTANLPVPPLGRVLDLGCGWGALALAMAALDRAAQVTASDVNQRALDLCRENFAANGLSGTFAHSNGFAALDGAFDLIVTNPPIRAGKAAIYRLFAESAAHLAPKGRLLLVIRKQQGAPSAKTYLETLFESVEIADRSKGYWILRCSGPISIGNES